MMTYKKNIILFRINSVLIKKKEFDKETVYSKEYLKTKIKSHDDQVRDFYDKEVPNLDPNHTCLAVAGLDFVLKNDESYISKSFLKSVNILRKK